MKTVESGQFAANIDKYLQDAVAETIIVTKAGKPFAVVRGLDYCEKQIRLLKSHEFWSMIAERREGPTVPWDEAKRHLKELGDE